jgi:hypothetical protein
VAKKGHSEEQILRALRQAEGGTRVADIGPGVARSEPERARTSRRRDAGARRHYSAGSPSPPIDSGRLSPVPLGEK